MATLKSRAREARKSGVQQVKINKIMKMITPGYGGFVDKIPLLKVPDKPLISTTQDFMPIAEIIDGLVLFKNGGAAIVLESTSLNFGLLSEREQDAVIAAYAALINSLSFHVQILVRTQKKDIRKYLNYIDEAMAKLKNEKIKALMLSYRGFITETVKKKNVLGKRFFLTVPFSPYELGITGSFKSSFSGKDKPIPYTKDYVTKKAKITLYPKRDHLARQAARLGLRLRQLTTEELVDLYYDIYNPRPELLKASDEEQEKNETV